MDVEVCYAAPDRVERVVLNVAAGCTVDEAFVQSGLEERLALDRSALAFAVFGRRATPQTVLAPGDRVELLRPLLVDPKEARRLRAARKRPTGAG